DRSEGHLQWRGILHFDGALYIWTRIFILLFLKELSGKLQYRLLVRRVVLDPAGQDGDDFVTATELEEHLRQHLVSGDKSGLCLQSVAQVVNGPLKVAPRLSKRRAQGEGRRILRIFGQYLRDLLVRFSCPAFIHIVSRIQQSLSRSIGPSDICCCS